MEVGAYWYWGRGCPLLLSQIRVIYRELLKSSESRWQSVSKSPQSQKGLVIGAGGTKKKIEMEICDFFGDLVVSCDVLCLFVCWKLSYERMFS